MGFIIKHTRCGLPVVTRRPSNSSPANVTVPAPRTSGTPMSMVTSPVASSQTVFAPSRVAMRSRPGSAYPLSTR